MRLLNDSESANGGGLARSRITCVFVVNFLKSRLKDTIPDPSGRIKFMKIVFCAFAKGF